MYAYVKILKPEDIEYKILAYLLKNNWTYSRDSMLENEVKVSRNTIHKVLKSLSERGLLISKREKRKLLYGIDPSLKTLIRSAM